MSIEALGPIGSSILQGIALPASASGEARAMFSDLQQLLRSDPQALAKDPGMRDLLNQAQALGDALRGLRKTPLRNLRPQAYQQLRGEAVAKLQQVMQSMKGRIEGLLQQSSPSVTEAATSRYGTDLAADIDKIMGSNASLEDKLALLAGLMSDHLDQEIEKLMKEYSNELKKPKEGESGSAGSTIKNIGLGILGAIFPGIGTAVAAAVSAVSGAAKGETRDKQKIDQLQTQIQLLNDKKKNFLQLVSNLMASESRTNAAIISNIRP